VSRRQGWDGPPFVRGAGKAGFSLGTLIWDDVEHFDVEPAWVGRRVCTRLESLRPTK